MRKRILTFALLLFVCLGLCLTSCGKTKQPSATTTPPATTPPETTPSDSQTVYVDIVKDGATAYQLVQPSRSSFQGVSTVAFSVYEAVSRIGASIPILNDAKAEKDLEILVGDTSRAASKAIADRVAAEASELSFYYVVAETDGKLVLYANDSAAYPFLEKYFLETYVKDGAIRIPEGCFDLQSMTWVAYQEYLDELARIEAEKLAAEKAAQLAALKAKNSEFKTSDFGAITTLPATAYPLPDVFPTEDAHPRILFTKNTIATVRANLTAEENKPAYSRYLEYTETERDGILPEVTNPDGDNMDYNVLAVIESKAFRYAMTGEENYAYEALIAIKNFMKTLFIATTENRSIHDYCRAYGYTMYVAACVYDWCYPVLSDADKQQLVAGVETYLAPYFEVGFPPKGQGSVTGHGTEAQLLRDWLAFGIAVYDEYPDVYNYVAGRIVSEFVPSTEFYLASGSHWQGSSYGAYRYFMLLYAQTLFSTMTDGSYKLFSDDLARPIVTFMNYLRPDDQALRIGDVYSEGGTTFSYGTYNIDAFYVAALYGDATVKGFAKSGLSNFSSFSLSNCTLTPAMFLALNDPTLVPSENPLSELPLVHYNGSPLGSIIARSGWNDENAVMVYMKIGEAYSANHEHKDAGSFQIFYKGILASDSGYYDSYGTPHDYCYNKQTISSNCLLIYNPRYTDAGKWGYSGGQSIHRPSVNGENSNLSAWLSKSTSEQAKILGSDYATKIDANGKEEYVFSYLAGDITNAYDLDTVDEVSRYMISVMTGDPENPMAFIVYDRITSPDARFKKTFLLHVQQEPTVDNDTMSAVVTNTKFSNSGKMFVQSLHTDVTYSVIGGPGKEFWVGDKNYPLSDVTFKENSIQESGWGRIEISPKEQSKTDRLLTVMYVTDAKNTAAMVAAKEIETSLIVGAEIFDKVTIFPKNAETIGSAFSFETEASSSAKTYYIAGLTAGKWTASVGGVTVTETVEKGGILTFTAPAGTVTLTPAFAPIRYELGGGKIAEGTTLPESYAYGETVSIPTSGIEKVGSEFLGWYTSPTFDAGTEFTATSATSTGEITLYAKWNRLFTVVDYVIGDGKILGDYEVRYVGEKITLPSAVHADGKYFHGWYTTPTFEAGSEITEVPAGLNPDADIKVYARYSDVFFSLDSAVNDRIGHQGTSIEKADGGFIWSNSGCTGGVHFTVPVSSQSNVYSITLDLAKIAGENPTPFVIRLRPKTNNKIDTAILTMSGGVLYLGSTSGPRLLDLNTDSARHTVTFTFSCNNAGMAAGLAAASGTQTTAGEYKSLITLVGYVDGSKVAETTISTFLTFGEGFSYVHGDGTALPSTMTQIQFYSGQITDATKYGKLLIDKIYVSETDLTK